MSTSTFLGWSVDACATEVPCRNAFSVVWTITAGFVGRAPGRKETFQCDEQHVHGLHESLCLRPQKFLTTIKEFSLNNNIPVIKLKQVL